MNNILIVKNKINNYIDEYIDICDNTITFKKSGNYDIYYEDCNNIDIVFNLCDNVYIKLFEYMNQGNIDSNIVYNLNDNAALIIYKFYSNKKTNENITVNLDGYLSRLDYNFSNICLGEEYYQIDINHKDRKTFSNISNKSIALKNSKLDFIINSNVGKNCNGSILDQNTRIVTMGECDARISPNMFIDLDDVVAKHGSVIGTFKDDQLFYLMSKGITYQDSLKLLIKGYLLSNIDVNLELRQKILEIIEMYWR